MEEHFNKYNSQQLINLNKNYRGTLKHKMWFKTCLNVIFDEI